MRRDSWNRWMDPIWIISLLLGACTPGKPEQAEQIPLAPLDWIVERDGKCGASRPKHHRNLMQKPGLTSRRELVQHSRRHGLIGEF